MGPFQLVFNGFLQANGKLVSVFLLKSNSSALPCIKSSSVFSFLMPHNVRQDITCTSYSSQIVENHGNMSSRLLWQYFHTYVPMLNIPVRGERYTGNYRCSIMPDRFPDLCKILRILVPFPSISLLSCEHPICISTAQ